MLHITGYGRGGPKSDRPGYGTLAEAMSGFAHVTGQPDGPPTLPPFMLADGVASLAGTYAVMMALYHRDVHGGAGQLIDVNLIEPLARLIESSTLSYDQLGVSPGRVGNRLDASAPRNAYRTADDKWLAISSASPNIAMRVYRAIDRPELADDPDYVDPVRRQERAGEVDELVADWVRAAHAGRGHGGLRAGRGHGRSRSTTPSSCAPTSTCRREARSSRWTTRTSVPMTVQAPVAVMSDTPGRIEHLGRALGADNEAVYTGLLGLDAERLAALRGRGRHLTHPTRRNHWRQPCSNPGPDDRSWPRRPAASACARRRPAPGPTSCSSTSRTPARRSPRRRRGRPRSPR